MSYYLKNGFTDDAGFAGMDLKPLYAPRGKICGVRETREGAVLFLRSQTIMAAPDTFFRIHKSMLRKLTDEMGVANSEDLVGREILAYFSQNPLSIEAISPARFDEEEFYRAS